MKKRELILLTVLSCASAYSVLSPIDVFAETRTPVFSSDPDAVKSRLENVRRLVMTSSGARRIIEGQDLQAQKQRAEAETHLKSAEAAFARNDITGTQESLNKATAAMFAAVRQVGTGREGVEKKNRDFDNKADSVDVLLNAVERVAGEKGDKADVLSRAKAIRVRAGDARKLAESGDIAKARSEIDSAYEDAKLELERLREGETLVRSLVFASAEEEYHYELDRNDTHQMLLQVLTSEKQPSPGMQRQIGEFRKQADGLRGQADRQAGAGKFKEAVDSLEQATKFLQRAIRSAGVYIPG